MYRLLPLLHGTAKVDASAAKYSIGASAVQYSMGQLPQLQSSISADTAQYPYSMGLLPYTAPAQYTIGCYLQ
jgi:hypothetical protein